MNMVESHDSCYSICSEKSHNSLSQDLSDSIAKEIAQPNVNNTESSTIDIVTEQYHLLLRNIDFATRLGYSVEQLETVLGKLGMNARQVGKVGKCRSRMFSFSTLSYLFSFIHDLLFFYLLSVPS